MRPQVDEDSWFEADVDPRSEQAAAASLAARGARIVGTKSFPVAAQRLEHLTRNPDCPIHEVVRVLETDPALSAHLLRLVNSAGFGLRVRCTAVRHAAALVGLDKLHRLATTAAVLDLFDSTSAEAGAVVEHLNIVAAMSRYLAGHLALDGDDLFTCGFLHDIGKLMMLETEGRDYARLLRKHHTEPDSLFVAERESYGFDHAALAGHVLSAWSIPDPVPKVVAWHHRVGVAYQKSTSIALMVNTVRLADVLSRAVARIDPSDEIVRIAKTDAASYLDISEQQLAAMWDDLRVLLERSRAVLRGEEPADRGQVSLRPRVSLRPSPREGTAPSDAVSETFEGPQQYSCVLCRRPSYGNRCGACSGYLCPEHEVGREGWCRLCVDEFDAARNDDVLRPTTRIGLGVGLSALAVAGYLIAYAVPATGAAKLLVAPAILVLLALIAFVVVRRAGLRARFLRSRPNRQALPIDSPFGSMYPQPRISFKSDAPESSHGAPDVDRARVEPEPAPMRDTGAVVPPSADDERPRGDGGFPPEDAEVVLLPPPRAITTAEVAAIPEGDEQSDPVPIEVAVRHPVVLTGAPGHSCVARAENPVTVWDRTPGFCCSATSGPTGRRDHGPVERAVFRVPAAGRGADGEQRLAMS